MSRPTRLGSLRRNVSTTTDQPPTPDCCDDDPASMPDRGNNDNGSVTVSLTGGSVPTFVGLGADEGGNGITISPHASTTTGDYMLAIMGNRGDAGPINGANLISDGWVELPDSPQSIDEGDDESARCTVYYKRHTGTQGGVAVSVSSGFATMVGWIASFRDVSTSGNGLAGSVGGTETLGGTITITGDSISEAALVVALADMIGDTGPPTLSSQANADLDNFTVRGSNIRNNHNLFVATGEMPSGGVFGPTTANLSITFPRKAFMHYSLAGDTALSWSKPEPATGDDDDSTCTDPIAGPDLLRRDLGAAYTIARIRLRLSTAGTGSRTYTLTAWNELDESDAVTLATFAFTATGAAQTIEETWLPNGSYRYYQLSSSSSEDVEVCTWEMYEPTLSQSHTHDHDDLTGRDDPQQHPADAVTYDNATSAMTATDVQAAIDELAQGGPAIHGIWRFDTSTTGADPGSGDVRYDSATPASVTNIYISQTNRPGSDCGRVFEYIEDGTPILFQQRTDAAAYLKVTVNGTPTDNGAWWTIPVTIVASGTLPSANADVSVVLFIGGGGGGSLDVTDGTTTVSPTTEIEFDGADFAVTDQGGGSALVEFIGAAGGAAAFIGARAYNSAAQTIGATTEAAATFDSEEFDTDGFHSTSSNTSRMTVPAGLGGKYLIQSHVGYAGSHGVIYARLKKNGTTFLTGSEDDLSSGSDSSLYPSAVIDLAAGDYVEVFAYRTTGTTIGATTGSFSCVLEIVKMDSGKVGAGIGAKAYNSATQVINNTVAAFTFDSEEYDTDGFHSTSVNTSRFTIPAGLGGKYLLQGGSYANGSTADWFGFRKNGSGTTVPDIRGLQQVGSTYRTMSVVADLVAGDYVEFVGGTSSNITFGHASSSFAQTWASIMRLDSGSGAATAGALLALVQNTAGGNKTTSSSTQADVDATNALVTFTVPGSGKVLVRAVCTVNLDGASNQNAFLGLRESTTDVINKTFAAQCPNGIATEVLVSWAGYVTGLTPGTSKTYKLAYAVNGGINFTVRASAASPMVIEVWAAP